MNRLFDHLRDAAEGPAELDLDLDRIHARVDRRRRTRVRLRAGACAAAAVVAVGGLGLAAGAGDGGGAVRAGEAGTEDTTVSEPSGETSSTSEATTTESTTTTIDPSTTSAPPDPTTTAPPGTTTPPADTAPPSTAPAAPPALTFTYVGDERWQLGQPECPEITHHLEARATAADGSVWALREDYCGRLEGDRWYGAGTWSLTAPDGSSLSGTHTSTVRMGQPGEPYTMVVEAGSGRLAEATGTCGVEVNVVPLGFGASTQDGTITCAVTVGDASATSDQVPPEV